MHKNKPLRNRKLLDLAHDVHECKIGIPGVCIGYSVEGCEPAHGPKYWLNGGGAMKSSDLHAAACHKCHVEIDQGRNLSREDRQFFWARGMVRTFEFYFNRGWLVIA